MSPNYRLGCVRPLRCVSIIIVIIPSPRCGRCCGGRSQPVAELVDVLLDGLVWDRTSMLSGQLGSQPCTAGTEQHDRGAERASFCTRSTGLGLWRCTCYPSLIERA